MELVRNTFPNNIVNVKDESATQRVTRTIYPLHMPIMFIRAAQGDDKIEWLNGREAHRKYGEQTFDQFEGYWRGEQYFLTNAIFPNQSAYIKRIVPADAKASTLVIEAHVIFDVQVPQYLRDEDGRYIYDEETGDPILELDAGKNPVMLPGVKIKYKSRKMTDQEIQNGFKNIPIKTITDGKNEYKIYPIATILYKSRCKMGNKSGMKLYIDINKQTPDLLEATGALLWTFVPMEQPYNSNVAYEITDKYETKINQMVMRPGQLDPYTNRRISAEDTILRLFYNEANRSYILPYDIHFYSENMEAIGSHITRYENNPNLTSGWMVNIASLIDLDGNPYHCAILDETDPDRVVLSNLTMHYLDGGEDGDTSDAAFEEGIRQILSLRVDPELGDRFHYMITHLYDVGYSLPTKFAMADFMASQKYCKIQMAAQDANRHLYNMDEAVSVAAAIRARCAITPESELYGTQAMRATIFAQAGYINDTSVRNIIPMTFWNAERRSTFHNSTAMKGSWAASPDNSVSFYRDLNFVPHSPTQKQLLWDGAANYIQWKDGTDKFMPSCRSIYKGSTSLLSDDEFTDAVIYLMYMTDRSWTTHVSRKLPFSVLAQVIQDDINKRAYMAFGSLYTVYSYVYLSEEDLANHDTLSIEISLGGDHPKRVWNTTIIARGRREV